MKSSIDFIQNILLHDCDLLFICEHWLTSHELSVLKQQFQDNNRLVHMKYSVNPTDTLIGRPYGGIGLIANRVQIVTHKLMNVDCDRITGVQLSSDVKMFLTVLV